MMDLEYSKAFEDNIACQHRIYFCSGEVWGIDTALLSACTTDQPPRGGRVEMLVNRGPFHHG